VVRLAWHGRGSGRHHKRGRFREELRRAREERAELRLQVGDLRDAITALQPPPAAPDGAPEIDPKLLAAMTSGRDGTGLVLDISGEETIVVVGDEARDPALVWEFLNRQMAS